MTRYPPTAAAVAFGLILSVLCTGRATCAVTLVRDGEPTATIVLAPTPTQAAQYAAYELQQHIILITGAEVPIAYGTGPRTGVSLYVGESEDTRRLGLRSADFADQEYGIRFGQDSVILMGRDADTPAPDSRPVAERHGEVALLETPTGGAYQFQRGCVAVRRCGFDDRRGTLEAWVELPELPEKGNGTILRLDGQQPWTYHMIEHRPTRKIRYTIYAGEEKGSGGLVSGELDPGWHHVLATHDAETGTIQLFVDGRSCGRSRYALTTCATATLGIGGMVPQGNRIGNTLTGAVAAVRISPTLRAPEPPSTTTFDLDEYSSCVVRLDGETPTVLAGQDNVAYTNDPPGWYEQQATCYAVFDFLERFCGVRWYAPGELGCVYAEQRILSVAGSGLRRRPAFRWRHSRCMSSAYGLTAAIWGNPSPRDVQQFARRLRYGGSPYSCNHSFYQYYQRFWNPDSAEPGAHRPEYFAKGYSGKPPQLCYTSPALIAQVAQDARDYFDGKAPPGARGAGEFFALVPMDNSQYCQCEACQASIARSTDTNPHFSCGSHSEYVFEFIDRIAREVAQTHPDKTLSALAYAKYAFRPKTLTVEPNVSVQMCVHARNWWAPGMEQNDMAFYGEWVREEKGRKLLLWLYYCFPELVTRQGFHCFPGFFAHTASRQFRMFHRDGIWGVGLGGGLGELVDTYVTSKLMDDPELDVDQLLDELFARFYGAAGDAMGRLYRRIEQIYSDPKYYPEEIRAGGKHSHQTEEMAWGYLGTAERMAELGALMAEVKSAPTNEVQRRRVELFDQAIWQYMVAGREAYEAKSAFRSQAAALKDAAPPSVDCPRSATAYSGDAAAVDFGRAAALSPWYTAMGYPPGCDVSGAILHDGSWLYLKLVHGIAASKLVNSGNVWSGDDWEIFVARTREAACRQIGVNPAGHVVPLTYGEKGQPWTPDIRVESVRGERQWTVLLAVPLKDLLPDGLKPGDTFLLNIIRGTCRGDSPLAWSPIFQQAFRCMERLGTVRLAQ